ncbi:Rossmann-like and DUF2520 domain-containing protein [Novosphingobium sediminicola]|uniref:Putative short-subunit dehydrogenase-like oxidoreductase (DUF2520 family) n=1 Tax=Novosphingobium sediminicola TaxID=563162 RepID=A0A7W6G698_9SPHN|nr:Rossmann-like and DUF2520 domain-containing protein [Novosphingobium sediminicola]MBB3953742.1 putative short-subunit dehydrogenase-like oxidoreductase (DUF2520 family) [Novosphingobium sediminicola]
MTQTPHFHRIGILGTGRVARALALGLAEWSGLPLMVWGRSRERAGQMGGEAAQSLAQMAEACDVIALAVSDDALSSVTAELAAVWPEDGEGFVFHVSGRSGLAPLEPLALRGAKAAAIHPAMTFTGDAPAELRRMAGARFAVTTAQADTAAIAHRLVAALGGVAVDIAEAQRPLYHAALCHAANHLVTLMAGSMDALVCAGVADGAALLAPLVRAALDNSLAMGFDALSGPLLRGDIETISGHITALERDCPELLPAYRGMAGATLDKLERVGAPPTAKLRQAVDG